MNFLNPIFLWLLPLTGIPLILHLLNRRNIVTIDFSSVRFLQLIEKESINRLQLLQLLLLILRTIIVLLLVLMITRPVLEGVFSTTAQSQSAVHTILYDNSFSQHGIESHILKPLNAVLEHIPGKNQVYWQNSNGGLQFSGLKEDLPDISTLTAVKSQSSNLWDDVYDMMKLYNQNYASKELYIISDGQESYFSGNTNQVQLLEEFNTYVIKTPELEENISIVDLALPKKVLIPNHPFQINVEIKNIGKNAVSDVVLQLVIDEMIVGQQLISLPAKSTKKYFFKTALSGTGDFIGKIEILNDDSPEDNQFFFNLSIPDALTIAIVGDISNSAYYFKTALKSLNESGSVIHATDYINLVSLGTQIFNQDVVIIQNPQIIQDITDSNLEEYINRGGHVIIFPDETTTTQSYRGVNDIAIDIEDDMSDLNKLHFSDDTYLYIEPNDIINTTLAEIIHPNIKGSKGIKIFSNFNLPFSPAATQIKLTGQSSLWNRYMLQSGTLDVFGIALNLNWSNFPLKGAFIPFVHYLVYSASNRNGSLYLSTDEYLKISLADYYGAKIYHHFPDGSQELLHPDDNNHLKTSVLQIPGIHEINIGKNNSRSQAVNIPQSELQSPILTDDHISQILPHAVVIPMSDKMGDEILEARVGIELWRYLLYTVIIFIIIEMILSNVIRQR